MFDPRDNPRPEPPLSSLLPCSTQQVLGDIAHVPRYDQVAKRFA